MIIKNVNVGKLASEFRQNGIYPFPVYELENGDGDFTFAEGTDMDLVQQIIDVHGPTPLPPQPTSEQQLTMEMTMAMAQMQMDNMMAIAELTNLIMAMGGM